MSFLSKVKSAFERLKSLSVPKKYVDFGIRVVEQLLEKVGLGTKTTQQLCKRRVEFLEEGYSHTSETLIAEIKTKFCSDDDFAKMEQVVAFFEEEAKQLTPVETGRLQKSLSSFVEKRGDELVGIIKYDINSVVREQNGRSVYYALAVHHRYAYHGRDKYPANGPRATWRFLEKAFENTELRRRTRELFE